ncbi:MAG TPA: hypothetical protein VIP11_25240 [Gemmatimonadaceae bacterium]
MTTHTFSDPALGSWSEVRARDSVTRYRRSGVGQAVLLLDGAGGASLWPELLHVLGANFRLIVPELPPGSADQGAALTEFLEGLGIAKVVVVAASDYSVPALDLVLRGVDQVSRLVLVPDGDAEDPDNTWFTTTAGPGSAPLLVVWRGMDPAKALPTVSRFVSGAAL